MFECRAVRKFAIPKLRGGVALVIVLLVMTGLGRPARAETLEQALADAYLINPVLNAERARVRAVDEQVAVAKSGLRPFISATGDYAYQNTDNDVSRPPGTTAVGGAFGIASAGGFPTGTSHPRGWAVRLTQPLFEGFQKSQCHPSGEVDGAGGARDLRTVEQTVLLDATTAYVNVVRDTAIVRLRENDVKVLTEQLKATKDRFDVGEVTRTDVAQAEARRSEALSPLAAAQANLKNSRAAYSRS